MEKQWFILKTKKDYEDAMQRYEALKSSKKGTIEHKEKMLLVTLIEQYEESRWTLPEVDPIEFIKIRMEDFGYRPADLVKVYGDKGTVSKVLNYKQPLSLTMIRKFSALPRIPPEALIKDYALQG